MERLARIEMLKNMLDKEPEDVFLNYALGLEYITDLRQASLAETQFKKVMKLDPDYVPAYYHLGKLFESITDKKQALSLYKEGLKLAEKKKDLKAAGELKESIFLLED